MNLFILQCLPPDFTISNGFKRKCRKIVLTDERERSWALDLRFNKSSDTFCITRGWRNFCEENGRKEGSLFKFKLIMRNEETPLLSVCPTESISDGTQGVDENIPQICRDSTLPNPNRFVTLTLTNDSLKSSRLVRVHHTNKSCWFDLSFLFFLILASFIFLVSPIAILERKRHGQTGYGNFVGERWYKDAGKSSTGKLRKNEFRKGLERFC